MKDIIRRFGGSIAIIGDFMLDKYIWGTVNRISPESPVPVVEYATEHHTLGGGGNVVMNVKALGGSPSPFGFIGDDDAGRKIVRTLEQHCISAQGIIVDPGRPTTLKTRILAQNQQLLRIDSESRSPVPEQLRAELLAAFRKQLTGTRAVVISDYNKGALSRSLFDEIIQLCIGSGIPTILDPKAFDITNAGPVTVITPNEKEAERFSGCRVDDPRSAEIAGQRLLQITQAQHVLITLGEHGMSLFSQTGDIVHMPTQSRDVYDVTGAGDTVVAVLSLALAAGATVPEAARVANLAAGIVVGKVGTATVSCDEMESALDGTWPTGRPNPRMLAMRAAVQ